MAGPDGKLLPGPWKSVGQRQRTHRVEQRPDGIYVQVHGKEGRGWGAGGPAAGGRGCGRSLRQQPGLMAQPVLPYGLSQLNLEGSLASDEYAHKHECGLRIQTGHLRLRQAPACPPCLSTPGEAAGRPALSIWPGAGGWV